MQKPPDPDEFVRRMINVNSDCFLVISKLWSTFDLANLLDVFPKLEVRVQEALQEKCKFAVKPITEDESDISKFSTVLLLCGPKLTHVVCDTPFTCRYHFDAISVMYIGVLYINLASLARGRQYFAQRLADACPNIEVFELYVSPHVGHAMDAADHIRVLADYVEHLHGNSKLKKFTIPLRFFQNRTDLEHVSRVLRNCCALEEISIIYGSQHGGWPLLKALNDYHEKEKTRQVCKLGIDVNLEHPLSYVEFCIDVLTMFTEVEDVSMRITFDEDMYRSRYFYERDVERIAAVIMQSDHVRKLRLLTDSAEVADIFKDHTSNLHHQVFEACHVHEGDDEYEDYEELDVCEDVHEVCFLRDGELTADSVGDMCDHLHKIKTVVRRDHEKTLAVLAERCEELRLASIQLENEEQFDPDIELLRDLNAINPDVASSVELNFTSAYAYKRCMRLYKQLVAEENGEQTMGLTLKLLHD